MKLTPIIEPDPAREILAEAGLLTSKSDSTSKKEISRYLDATGASIPELAAQISALSKGAQDDSIRLRAAELGLKCHGVLDKTDVTSAPQIVFIGADKAIVNVLIPR